jgi:hypothetical protein
MNEPAHAIHPNSVMDDNQLSVAAQFVDELLDIGALGTPLSLESVLTTTPLFCVPKPHQPGMWWVIADMKAGGQNATVGSDPVYLPRIGHILDELYTGGYTAVVDASKFFHQFSTHLADRPYLGIVKTLFLPHCFSGLGFPWEQQTFQALVVDMDWLSCSC